MTTYLLTDLLTGDILTEIQVVSGPWSTGINEAGSVAATVSLKDHATRQKNLRNVATVGKSCLVVVENDIPIEGGPIWVSEYSKDSQQATFTAAGMWSYFDHRVLIPLLAAGQSPLDVETFYENQSLTTIAKRLVQQAQAATGGNVPVILPAEIAGTETREYLGSDLGTVGEALNDLTAVEGGPEISFVPRYTADRTGIEWVMKVGTPEQPQISAASVSVWDYNVPDPSIKSLNEKIDGSKLTSTSWAMSGSSSSESLYSVYPSSLLTGQGYPALDVVGTYATDEQSELDGFARESARIGSKPISFWSFLAKANASPRVGEYSKGDYCRIKIKGDPWIPDATGLGHRRRITNLAGDEKGQWISITVGEVYALNG